MTDQQPPLAPLTPEDHEKLTDAIHAFREIMDGYIEYGRDSNFATLLAGVFTTYGDTIIKSLLAHADARLAASFDIKGQDNVKSIKDALKWANKMLDPMARVDRGLVWCAATSAPILAAEVRRLREQYEPDEDGQFW